MVVAVKLGLRGQALAHPNLIKKSEQILTDFPFRN